MILIVIITMSYYCLLLLTYDCYHGNNSNDNDNNNDSWSYCRDATGYSPHENRDGSESQRLTA